MTLDRRSDMVYLGESGGVCMGMLEFQFVDLVHPRNIYLDLIMKNIRNIVVDTRVEKVSKDGKDVAIKLVRVRCRPR